MHSFLNLSYSICKNNAYTHKKQIIKDIFLIF